MEQFRQKLGHSKGTKNFVSVLMLFKEHEEKDVTAAVEEALVAGVSSSESVEHILINRIAPEKHLWAPLKNWETLPPPDVSVYDRIGGEI